MVDILIRSASHGPAQLRSTEVLDGFRHTEREAVEMPAVQADTTQLTDAARSGFRHPILVVYKLSSRNEQQTAASAATEAALVVPMRIG
jgi:hypothetical protein